jgi:dihydrodipicolinate synthase/N-acetylneuraminate lyase
MEGMAYDLSSTHRMVAGDTGPELIVCGYRRLLQTYDRILFRAVSLRTLQELPGGSRMKAKEFTGIIPPLLSSFTKSGEIFEKGLRALIRFTLPFVHGYYPIGTYGCGPLMSVEERKRVLAIILEEVNGKVPVVAHTGHPGTQPTIELSRDAKSGGAAGVGAIAPYYAPHLPEENLYAYFGQLIDAVNEEEFPVFVYNNLHYSQNAITPKLLHRLAEHGLRGCKDSSFDLVNFFLFQDAVCEYPDFNVIVGTEAFFMAAFDAGATGMVCGLANAFPDLLKKLHSAYKSGDRALAMDLQRIVLRVRNLAKTGPTVPILHEILKLRGIDAGYARSPLIQVEETVSNKLRTELRALSLL